MSAAPQARRLWERYEPVHDVVYFSPECRAAAAEAGLKGFWMGYFAFRAAPLGPVGPAPVTAAFHGFHPDRVARALPDAWRFAPPERALDARLAGSAAALTRVWGAEVAASAEVAEAADLAWEAAQATEPAGRVLGAANRVLPRPSDPVRALWQATTTLREHRGDGHVAALVSRGIGPVEAHLLKTAAGESDPEMLREARRWSADEWQAAAESLRTRGLLTPAATLTESGRAERTAVEAATDHAAATPWRALGPARTTRLAELLDPLAASIHASGVLPPRNPVGLTHSG